MPGVTITSPEPGICEMRANCRSCNADGPVVSWETAKLFPHHASVILSEECNLIGWTEVKRDGGGHYSAWLCKRCAA